MNAERWQRVNNLFLSVTERTPEERVVFLDQSCQGDEGLRRQVESLLASSERAANFIEAPAFEVAPELLTNDEAGAMEGALVGHYRIESLIGVGGMGEVYLARDEILGRKVALKLLSRRVTSDEAQLSRFKLEARTASALNHPNILTVYEIDVEGDRPFIATEFIEGTTLRAALARGRMNLDEALEIVPQVASALAAAHAAGVVHRDIKPENIMLRPDGYAKVLDFGIAKLTEQPPESPSPETGTTAALQTRPGLVLGTGRYMSPEQARGHPVDARTDIWSLGVVLYEMAGGSPPFRGETPSDCIAAILQTEPPPLTRVFAAVPAKLQAIVQKALRKNPAERYQTMPEMLAELRTLRREGGDLPRNKFRRHRRAALLALSVATLAAAALACFLYFVRPGRSPNEKSIAVLPFADLSPGRDQAYFCEGIQEEILTRLAKISDLKVISRTSVQKYQSAPANLREIARELGVSNILEGSVQKSGDAVRVRVQLINAQDDTHRWAEIYDRKLIDLFAVESDISRTIANTLRAKLTGTEVHAIAARPTENTEAHQLYLKGRFFWNKRTGADLQKALDYFHRAVAADPSYAVAYAGISDVYGLLPLFSSGQPQENNARSEAAARKALELNDTLAEAHTSLGAALARRFDFTHAETEFKRAIELNPNYSTAHHWYSDSVLAPEVRLEEALAEMQRALEVDPLSPIINGELAMTYYALGQYDKALEQCRRTLDLEPGFYVAHMWLADALEATGDSAAAIAEYEKAWALSSDPVVLGWLARTYAISGKRAEALKIFEQLNEIAKTHYVPDYTFAIANLGLENKEETLRWLEQCYEDGASDLQSLKSDPRLRPLHGEPRYQRLVAQVFSEEP